MHSLATCYSRAKSYRFVVDLGSVLQTTVVEDLLAYLEQGVSPAALKMVVSRRIEGRYHWKNGCLEELRLEDADIGVLATAK